MLVRDLCRFARLRDHELVLRPNAQRVSRCDVRHRVEVDRWQESA